MLSTTSSTFLRRQICADGGKIAEPHQRIGRRLHVDHTRVLADRPFHILRLRCVDVRELQAEAGHHLVEEARRSAIEIVATDHVIAGLQHGHDRVNRSHAARKNASSDSAFKRSQILFQAGARGIGHAGILISLVLADSLLHISRGRIDRHRDRAGQGSGSCPAWMARVAKPGSVRFFHE